MDLQTAQFLRELNNRFYAQQAQSFSSTRHAAWAGWEECLLAIGEPAPDSVLDVACGNMRFAAFCHEFYPDHAFAYTGVDSCDDLAEPSISRSQSRWAYRSIDVLEGLLRGESLAARVASAVVKSADPSARVVSADSMSAELAHVDSLPVDSDSDSNSNSDSGSAGPVPADLVACFGFMHHVPGADYRAAMVRQLVECARPGGYVAISFWQFCNSPDMAARARETTKRGVAELAISEDSLEPGDYLLGWQNQPGAYRYCHHFADEEVLDLVRSVQDVATCVTTFSADGRTGNLNRYVILRRLP